MTHMQIALDHIETTCQESEVYNRVLSLDDKRILDIGCGNAIITRDIATGGRNRHVIALETDEIQHAKNLAITDLPNVTFKLAGAQAIPEPSESIDVVLMFKSLHHVPIDLMAAAMKDIHRVLKSGGFAYISEPIFAGEFNDILRIFHDEQQVRIKAFEAVRQVVTSGLFELERQLFFKTILHFSDFSEFREKVLNVTHTRHELSEETYRQVEDRFVANMRPDGVDFHVPIRVDLLSKTNEHEKQ